MSKYRNDLPQLGGENYLCDSGLETTLVFHDGIDLPCFASFPLLRSAEGKERLARYFRKHAAIAARHGAGCVLETVTWRAHSDWGKLLGYTPEALDAANREAVEMLFPIREEFEHSGGKLVISGNIGPRGDGYNPESFMTAEEAEAYHTRQVGVLEQAGADLVTAMTITYSGEAIGIVRAAKAAGIPVVISFTLETDGRLPSGQRLGDAIRQVDRETDGYAAYFMINCAHPDHFENVLESDADWLSRIHGLRANASRMSHAELDNATELDPGDPQELGRDYHRLVQIMPNLRVLGGCCGTDHRHIEQIAIRCVAVDQAA